MRRVTSAIPTLFIALAVACGGDSTTSPGNTDDDDPQPPGDTRVVEADPAYGAVVQEIWDRRGCSASQCHGSTQEAGLDLRAGASHGELVGVTATSEPIVRVIPGDAANSYLVIKLEGRQQVGVRMPKDATPLDDIDLTNVRNWIDQGAKNN